MVRDNGKLLLCRMAPDRGVSPGQWALPGGGVEDGERIEDALRREAREELGIAIDQLRPVLFKDALVEKQRPDGTREPQHLIFLIYECTASAPSIRLNEEFDAYAWVADSELSAYNLNQLTKETLASLVPEPRARSDQTATV